MSDLTRCMLACALALAASVSAAESLQLELDDSVHGVAFGGAGDIRVEIGDEPGLRLSSDDGLDEIEVEVRDGILHIRHEERGFTGWLFGGGTPRIEADIVLAQVDDLSLSGAGNLDVTGARGDRLQVSLSGAGDCDLRDVDVTELKVTVSGAGGCRADGRVEYQEIRISGAGEYRARDLASVRTRIQLSGAADAELAVRDHLDATVSGAGNIAYAGDATVEKRVSGFGSIDRVD